MAEYQVQDFNQHLHLHLPTLHHLLLPSKVPRLLPLREGLKKMWNCENFSLYIHLFQNIGELKKVWNYNQFAPPPPSVWKIPHTFFYPFPKYTLQFWPQFPLGRITPSEIENFIRDSSSNIHNDCQLSAVSAFILILSSFQGLVMWADSVSSNAKNIIILWECKINYKYLISSSQYQA